MSSVTIGTLCFRVTPVLAAAGGTGTSRCCRKRGKHTHPCKHTFGYKLRTHTNTHISWHRNCGIDRKRWLQVVWKELWPFGGFEAETAGWIIGPLWVTHCGMKLTQTFVPLLIIWFLLFQNFLCLSASLTLVITLRRSFNIYFCLCMLLCDLVGLCFFPSSLLDCLFCFCWFRLLSNFPSYSGCVYEGVVIAPMPLMLLRRCILIWFIPLFIFSQLTFTPWFDFVCSTYLQQAH